MLVGEYLVPRREGERDLVRRAVLAGSLSPEIDPDDLFDAFLGPIVLRRMMGQNVGEEFVERLVAAALQQRTG